MQTKKKKKNIRTVILFSIAVSCKLLFFFIKDPLTNDIDEKFEKLSEKFDKFGDLNEKLQN